MEPILRAEKLTKRFGELTANREIDIEIHAGEIHAIAGENGAGKSTLMKMLYGVYQPTAGNLYIDGEKMERWNPTIAREKGIGMVFQDFRLVPAFTVLENVFLTQSHPTAAALLACLFVAVFGTAVAHTCWNKSLQLLNASTCSMFYPLQPLVSAVMGVLLLHEVITPSFVIGAVLICAGVVVTFLPSKAK